MRYLEAQWSSPEKSNAEARSNEEDHLEDDRLRFLFESRLSIANEEVVFVEGVVVIFGVSTLADCYPQITQITPIRQKPICAICVICGGSLWPRAHVLLQKY